MQGVSDMPERIIRLWASIKNRKWDELWTCLAADFVRCGTQGGDDDTCVGPDDYVDYMSTVVSRWQSFEMEVLREVWDPRTLTAVLEVRESLTPPDGPTVGMHFLAVHEVDDHGLVRRLDLFEKRPTGTLPSWVTPAGRKA